MAQAAQSVPRASPTLLSSAWIASTWSTNPARSCCARSTRASRSGSSFCPSGTTRTRFIRQCPLTRERLRSDLAERLGLARAESDDARFILLAGRLTEIKKPLLAIDALAALTQTTHPAARLLVAGSGELLDDAHAHAAQLGVAGRVHFMGDLPRERVAELMQASDSLLLTARSEGGGPRVVLEALACGLPVVSTSVVEIRRTVEPGVNGWLVDEATPASLAAGLAWVLDQAPGSLAPAAINAAAPFTARRMLAGLYDTYRALVS